MKALFAGGLIAFIVIAFLYGLSWLGTCAIIKLITVCFGWTFKWSIATGVWLVICLLKNIFSHHTTVNNK